MKNIVTYLGFVVCGDGIRTSSSKVEATRNYTEPRTLFNGRSLLGLASYYRCFITDFASSKKIPIKFNEKQLNAFNKLEEMLMSEDVILFHLDFTSRSILRRTFHHWVYEQSPPQGGKPTMIISRTLKDRKLISQIMKMRKMHALEEVAQLDAATIYREAALTYTIESSENHSIPFGIKSYWRRLNSHENEILYFAEKSRHIIQFTDTI